MLDEFTSMALRGIFIFSKTSGIQIFFRIVATVKNFLMNALCVFCQLMRQCCVHEPGA